MSSPWKFDRSVAQGFGDYAERHIPHYRSVLDKSVMICQRFADPNDAIIDIGSATGETLKLLYQKGFRNLFGIDTSQDMLDQCPQGIATLCCSDRLVWPPEFFKVMLCNWTLHFISDKQRYLHDMTTCLAPGGAMVISDKHTQDPLMIEFYHEFKRQQGVSQQEIEAKAQSLQGVMNLHGVEWYQDQFESLGLQHRIIDADWAFISFLVQKPG